MTSIAIELAQWAAALEPTEEDRALAERSLIDTLAVSLAAHDQPIVDKARHGLSEAGVWAVAAHILDFDDLHMESTSHVSAVSVPVALAAGGGHHTFLVAAGVMSRLGTALGWHHYSAGWHATCTAGAPAAAAAAAVAMGLDVDGVAVAMALAVPAAGGVQRAFGSDAKSIQVGMAVDSGLRAAELAAAGVGADVLAVNQWLKLVGGEPTRQAAPVPAVPGGLATKVYPACYALQRPISLLSRLCSGVGSDEIERIRLVTPKATVAPLNHHRPTTGLQGKFSLEYAAAVACLDAEPGFDSFTDAAVRRSSAQRLVELVDVHLEPGGAWLLEGRLEAEVHLSSGEVLVCGLAHPPGSPSRPLTHDELMSKAQMCAPGAAAEGWTWDTGADVLRTAL